MHLQHRYIYALNLPAPVNDTIHISIPIALGYGNISTGSCILFGLQNYDSNGVRKEHGN